MHKAFQNALFYIIVFTLTYFLFVYPFVIFGPDESKTKELFTSISEGKVMFHTESKEIEEWMTGINDTGSEPTFDRLTD